MDLTTYEGAKAVADAGGLMTPDGVLTEPSEIMSYARQVVDAADQGASLQQLRLQFGGPVLRELGMDTSNPVEAVLENPELPEGSSLPETPGNADGSEGEGREPREPQFSADELTSAVRAAAVGQPVEDDELAALTSALDDTDLTLLSLTMDPLLTQLDQIIGRYENLPTMTAAELDMWGLLDLIQEAAEAEGLRLPPALENPTAEYERWKRNMSEFEAITPTVDVFLAERLVPFMERQNELVATVLEDYGRANGFWMDSINGQPPRDVLELMEGFGLSERKAAEVSSLSQKYNVDKWALGISLAGIDVDNLPDYRQPTVQVTDVLQQAADAGVVDVRGGYARHVDAMAGVDEDDRFGMVASSTDGADTAEFNRFVRSAELSQQAEMRRRARAMKEGTDKYGYDFMAVVHSLNPVLAAKLYHDPYQVTAEEVYDLEKELNGWDVVSQLPGAAAQVAWLKQQQISGGTQGQSTVNVDKAGGREAARQLAAAWNLPDVSDDFLDRMISSYSSTFAKQVKANLPNPFNIDRGTLGPRSDGASVRTQDTSNMRDFIRERMRETAGYQELFANMGSGMSEEEYVRQFEGIASTLFGAADATEAVRAGMRTGDTRAVGQAGLLNTDNASTNSTFQGRMAQMASVFKSKT